MDRTVRTAEMQLEAAGGSRGASLWKMLGEVEVIFMNATFDQRRTAKPTIFLTLGWALI